MSTAEIPRGGVVRTVFLCLVMDLLAFTMPLPLFPRLIASFVQLDAKATTQTPTLLSRTLALIRACRKFLASCNSSLAPPSTVARDAKWDITILGGLLGSLFSFCQFLVSPYIGRLSDDYGRRPILLLTMLGNIASALLWLFSTTFGTYLLSRVMGGLSEGNVQLSIAVISDVSDSATRARSLALVGIAFSICFTVGPSLGAWFAMRSPPPQAVWPSRAGLNVYAAPAAVSLVLLSVETLFIWMALPETRHLRPEPQVSTEEALAEDKVPNVQATLLGIRQRKRLGLLRKIHALFLFFFSGAEFTLTFLTYDLYGFTNTQNGRLLSFIGVLSSLLQGVYTRKSRSPPLALAISGIKAYAISMLLLSILPLVGSPSSQQIEGTVDCMSSIVLYSAAAALAYVSASVVNSLNTLASLECDQVSTRFSSVRSGRGKDLGDFRSAGQLGRALGPIFATALYWTRGPTLCYVVCGAGSVIVYSLACSIEQEDRTRAKSKVS